MKNLLIVILVIALGYFGWKAIQTKPDPAVPTATVSDTTAPTTPTEAVVTPEPAPSLAGKAVDNANVTVSFKGFGPGKEHLGTISDVRSNLALSATGDLTGTITVGMDSLKTDTEAVTKHLKTNAFFDVVKYPTATFKLTNLTGMDAQGAQATGTFTIHGVTKTVVFPVKVVDPDPCKSLAPQCTKVEYQTTFTLSLKDFGINQTFANETIELSVVVPTTN
jgi:polyisoprenoid-binding protein YceI